MLDDLDRRLLALLRTDSRAPVASLAAKLKVSRGTVQNRIAKMLAPGGAIQAFTVRTRPEMEAARVRAIMCIEVEGGRSGAVVQALRGFPEVGVARQARLPVHPHAARAADRLLARAPNSDRAVRVVEARRHPAWARLTRRQGCPMRMAEYARMDIRN